MVSAHTLARVTEAVLAVRSEDSEAATRAMGYLVAEPPDDVVEELGARLLGAADLRGGRPLTASVYSPDPAVAARLVEAFRAEDIEAIHAVVGDSYSGLLAAMVCTLAALES